MIVLFVVVMPGTVTTTDKSYIFTIFKFYKHN